MGQAKVFISYSHRDTRYLDWVKSHLAPLEGEGLIKSWDDTEIMAGQDWKQVIDGALATAKVVILLVSAEYLKSPFIRTEELPHILRETKEKGTYVLPIIVSACGYKTTKGLKDIQAFNPNQPLISMKKPARESFLEKVAERVNQVVNSLEPVSPNTRPAAEPDAQIAVNGEKSGEEVDTPPAGHSDGHAKSAGVRWDRFLWACAGCLALGLVIGALIWKSRPSNSTRVEPEKSPGVASTGEGVGCGKRETHRTDNFVIIVGGGSVYSYLKKIDPCIFVEINNNSGANVRDMQIPTGVSAEIFAHTYGQLPDTEVIVMSSQKLPPGQLRRIKPREGEKGPTPGQLMEPALFEAYLGADPLQMLLVTGEDNSANKGERKVFNEILQSSQGGTIDFHRIDVSLADKYKIYVGSETSATKSLWLERLSGKNIKLREKWNSKLLYWDVQTADQIATSTEPAIYLGSKALFDSVLERIKHKDKEILTLVNENSKVVRRGLYFYGWVNTSRKKLNPDSENKLMGYELSEGTTKILRTVYKILDGKKAVDDKNEIPIDRPCIADHMGYFNLDADTGWVKDGSVDAGNVYRLNNERCRDRPPY